MCVFTYSCNNNLDKSYKIWIEHKEEIRRAIIPSQPKVKEPLKLKPIDKEIIDQLLNPTKELNLPQIDLKQDVPQEKVSTEREYFA